MDSPGNVNYKVRGDGKKQKRRRTGYNTDKAPRDDCCPICFGEFKVPCRSDCGHWFCGKCILRLWEFRSMPSKCKCPFCSSSISTLTPEESALKEKAKAKEVVQVLDDIHHYNWQYICGLKEFPRVHVAEPRYISWFSGMLVVDIALVFASFLVDIAYLPVVLTFIIIKLLLIKICEEL